MQEEAIWSDSNIRAVFVRQSEMQTLLQVNFWLQHLGLQQSQVQGMIVGRRNDAGSFDLKQVTSVTFHQAHTSGDRNMPPEPHLQEPSGCSVLVLPYPALIRSNPAHVL